VVVEIATRRADCRLSLRTRENQFMADSVEKHRVAGAESGVLKRARAPFL
jgi:hypothetical protein